MTQSNQNVAGGGGAVRVPSRSCLGRPLRVSGSVYEVSASYPAGLRKLHVCVDMIRSPDCASFFKLLCWHLRVPGLCFSGFFASDAEVPLVLGACLPLGGGWAADVCTHVELKPNVGSQVLLLVQKDSDLKPVQQTGTLTIFYQRAGLWESFEMASCNTGNAFCFFKAGLELARVSATSYA